MPEERFNLMAHKTITVTGSIYAGDDTIWADEAAKSVVGKIFDFHGKQAVVRSARVGEDASLLELTFDLEPDTYYSSTGEVGE